MSFRTFIMPVLKNTYDKSAYQKIDMMIGIRARNIIKINNIFLIISGLYLLSFHLDAFTILLFFKALVGLIVALGFYFVPVIMKRFTHIVWFSPFFHYLYFSLMICVVIISQIVFYI
ncbi:hypothetical protein [Poseidonibacter ostreae]|uniref:Uncharacterized protein n=1 Tax=Poseidonibacter ostreae TaxID=2654171 RepID=A0ABQ6VMI6_9BACT|nr:hypothetical protein [Poseidonibacter ostreae]KAB7891839.1 hypothetical protein GBG18_05230 [Poseidonibacter ostreae]